MKLLRTSREFKQLKQHIESMAAGQMENSVPPHMLTWISHLIDIKRLVAADPGLSSTLSWEELEGLAIIQECADKSSDAKSCPRCKSKSANPYTCTKCGFRLVA
jgi:hypothetical protein